ncbi:esterase E4 [Anabrus simplex]|uniref:esterase E4 n=1 Tax=Anabrus simplex TaxID=316456 RepID=UPI0034DD45A7
MRSSEQQTNAIYFLVSIAFFICLTDCSETDHKDYTSYAPVINTTDGPVRGKIIQSRQGKTVYAYLGIPYSKAPVGNLRFQYPRRPEPWSKVRDATREGNRCPQLSYPERKYEGDEDCLFLNVYTTRLPVNDSIVGTVVWDVVVLIHAGGFTFGSGDADMYGPDNLLDKDVVLVTFNHRLGALGFLSTDDEAASGNYGLKDQVDVLRWVHRNIARFSGNPKSVTLLGAHSGAASAHYHMLSTMSKNLVHGVISQSGTGLSPWALVSGKTARHRAFRLGELVGCKKTELSDSSKLVKCLRQKQSEELVKQSVHVMEWSHDLSFPFVPVVEPTIPNIKPFLYDTTENLINNLKWPQNEIPWIIGVASHEGLPQALNMMVFPKMLDELNSNPEKFLPLYLGMDTNSEVESHIIARKAWDFYLKNETLHYGNLIKLAELTSDYNYFWGVSRSVALHSASAKAPVFVYLLTYNPRDTHIVLGVPQGDDTRYLFPDTVAGTKLQYEANQLKMVDRLVKLVINFARDGDPTPEEHELFDNVLWPVAESTDFQYINIGDKMKIVSEGFYPERIDFWNRLMKRKNTQAAQKDEL